MDLSGANETMARGVYMHVCCQEGSKASRSEDYIAGSAEEQRTTEDLPGRSPEDWMNWLRLEVTVPVVAEKRGV
jgi:hypothetical protein